MKEDEDLQFSIDVYKNGNFKDVILKTEDDTTTTYKNDFISFAVSENTENHKLKLIEGIPSGLATTFYSSKMTAFSFNRLVDEKITLEKNKPVYLVGWLGTTKNILRSIESENGELPENLEDIELAFLYKILWTN